MVDTLEKPSCPICRQILRVSGTDSNMYYCSDAANTHATVLIGPDGNFNLQILDIGPYSITIINTPDIQRTVIRKFNSIYNKTVLELSKALQLPWHDKNKVMEKIGIYLLFS